MTATRRSKLPLSPEAMDWRYHYKAGILGSVVTGSEITEIWNVSRATLDRAWERGEVEARKAVTGGTVLFTVRSIVAKFGEPKKDYVKSLNGDETQLSLFDLDALVAKHGV
jgi:hypothetical protein